MTGGLQSARRAIDTGLHAAVLLSNYSAFKLCFQSCCTSATRNRLMITSSRMNWKLKERYHMTVLFHCRIEMVVVTGDSFISDLTEHLRLYLGLDFGTASVVRINIPLLNAEYFPVEDEINVFAGGHWDSTCCSGTHLVSMYSGAPFREICRECSG